MTKETKYIKVRDKRKNLFGIKIAGHKDWYVAPMFEQLGIRYSSTARAMPSHGRTTRQVSSTRRARPSSRSFMMTAHFGTIDRSRCPTNQSMTTKK